MPAHTPRNTPARAACGATRLLSAGALVACAGGCSPAPAGAPPPGPPAAPQATQHLDPAKVGATGGYSNSQGAVVIAPEYDFVGRFSEGLALVAGWPE